MEPTTTTATAVEATQLPTSYFMMTQIRQVSETFADVVVFGDENIMEYNVMWTRKDDPTVTFSDVVQKQDFATEMRLQPLPAGKDNK